MIFLSKKRVKIVVSDKATLLKRKTCGNRRRTRDVPSKTSTFKKLRENVCRVDTGIKQGDSYIVFSQNSRLLIGHQKDGQIQSIEPFTAQICKNLDSGGKLIIKPKGMSKVQVASVIKAVSDSSKVAVKMNEHT